MLDGCSKWQYYCLVKHSTHAKALNPCHNNNIAILSTFARSNMIEKIIDMLKMVVYMECKCVLYL